MSRLEERVARVEGIVEQMDKRLNHIETELRDLREEFVAFRKEINERFRNIDERFEGLRKEVLAGSRVLEERFLVKLQALGERF
ncbi:MAG: hypothetical protein LM555_03255 [Desulfurococcaceae archaeon]|nr:hypothetical protein [Desulfurococcaceae archaeon]